MQKARSHALLVSETRTHARFYSNHCAPTACKYTVSGSISLPSTGFFSFFSRLTSFTIGRKGILSLRRWSSLIHAGFHVSDATWVVSKLTSAFVYGTFTLFGLRFPTLFY